MTYYAGNAYQPKLFLDESKPLAIDRSGKLHPGGQSEEPFATISYTSEYADRHSLTIPGGTSYVFNQAGKYFATTHFRKELSDSEMIDALNGPLKEFLDETVRNLVAECVVKNPGKLVNYATLYIMSVPLFRSLSTFGGEQ